MPEDLDTLYKILTRERTTGYSGSSVLGSFEKFVMDWCNNMLSGSRNQRIQRTLRDMKSTVEGYGVSSRESRERKIVEMGRMLLSLRDLLQNAADEQETSFSQPDHEERDTHQDIGIAYKQEGKITEAIAEFEKAIESNPDDHFSLSHLAHIYYQQGKFENASRLIDDSLKLNPSNPFAHSVKGEILFAEGRMEESATIFGEILNLKPDDTYAHGKLGVIYRKQGRMKEAISIIERGLEIDPDDPSLHHALGDVYAWQDKDEEAIEEYQKAIELDPEDKYAFRRLLSSKSRGRNAEAVISQLQKVLKIPSRRQNPHLHALLASYLKREKRYEEAIDEFGEAVRLHPNSQYFRIQLAFCYSKLGQYNKVIELLEPIHKFRSTDPIITRALAKAYEEVDRISDARKLLIDILYEYPNDHSLRSALMKLGKSKPSHSESEKENGKQNSHQTHRESAAGL
jgi:tetratricopeptide (TPR) repeat protein